MRPVPAPSPPPERGRVSDEELLAAVALSDEAAFGQLYDRLAGNVFGIVRKVVKDPSVAEEVSQEVMVEVWRTAPRYDRARGSARTWVLVLAHRRAVDAVRSEQRHRDRTARAMAQPDGAAPDVESPVVAGFERARVRAALHLLTETQRQSIELAYYGGLSQSQVAEALDLPLGTVKTRTRDGLIRLRDALAVGHE